MEKLLTGYTSQKLIVHCLERKPCCTSALMSASSLYEACHCYKRGSGDRVIDSCFRCTYMQHLIVDMICATWSDFWKVSGPLLKLRLIDFFVSYKVKRIDILHRISRPSYNTPHSRDLDSETDLLWCYCCSELWRLVDSSIDARISEKHTVTTFQPWKWRKCGSPKRYYLPTNLHGATTQKNNIDILREPQIWQRCPVGVFVVFISPPR